MSEHNDDYYESYFKQKHNEITYDKKLLEDTGMVEFLENRDTN